MRFADGVAETALQTGFVEIAGTALRARGRYFQLKATTPPSTNVVHVQIDHTQQLAWSPMLRHQLAAAVLHYARATPAKRVQIDFEVRASERQVLLDLLGDVRAGLPHDTLLSMTALASWCMSEDWLDGAPVDEIVPMLFRMQQPGENLRKWLAQGGDFRNLKCRSALAISTDSVIVRAPPGRRVYLFNPRSWDALSFRKVQHAVEAWR